MDDEGRPEWDAAFASRLEGAVVLIGLTIIGAEGESLEQFHGTVSADPAEGIRVRLEGSREGESYKLPPDLRGFFPAAPGSYRLRSTGEVVRDPDYISNWTIEKPKH